MSNTTRLSLIQVLSDGEFHSGEQLGTQLGISRSAIAKHINILQKWGLDIFRVQGKGYCLSHQIELLDENALVMQSGCPTWFVHSVLDSTNQFLLDRMGQVPNGALCVAEYQEAGRGRRGRQWCSPFGSNIYLSLYWRLEAGVAAAMGLSLVVGIVIADVLTEFGVPDVRVKWPNDIYVHDKKLAGILVEMTGQTGDAAHLIIGVGLNLMMSEQEGQSIDQAWTSVNQCTDQPISRNALVARLGQALTAALVRYEIQGLSGFIERWAVLDNYYNRPIRLIMGNNEVRGIGRGIDETGALLLETDQGIKSFVGGEISLRGDNAVID